MSPTELESANGRRWLLSDHGNATLLVEEHLRDDCDASLPALLEEVPPGESTFIVLVPRADAPKVDPHYGRPIASLLCSPGIFADFLARHPDCWPETFLYAMLKEIAAGVLPVDRLLV